MNSKINNKYILSGILACLITFAGAKAPSAHSQIPNFFHLNPAPTNLFKPNSEDTIASTCIHLSGSCLFKIAAQKSDLLARKREIEQRLADVSDTYFKNGDSQLNIYPEKVGNLEDIYISAGYKEVRLLSVTSLDADLEGVDIEQRSRQIIQQLATRLQLARRERQKSFLLRRGGIAILIVLGMGLSHLVIARYQHKLKTSLASPEPPSLETESLSTQLQPRQHKYIQEVKYLLSKILQAGIWFGGSLFILGLFPHTRPLQLLLVSGLQIPFRVGIVALGTYVTIRLSYALIARLSDAISHHSLITQEANHRLRLRLTTVTGISKSVVTVTSITIGTLIALSAAGINIAPLLAGAGIIGIAISFASQSLIKDTINGFFIIFEDQYGVGDVIDVGGWAGLVENMNLRITQLRDGEGRLITIPNSEIRAVANLSSQWSRADLNIPIAYQTDVDQALELITAVAENMSHDDRWSVHILDAPQVLGVDNFGDRGVIVKVWIKTKPLKQWEVSREFRRRLKVAFDGAGIPIPPPQQQIWFNRSSPNGFKGNVDYSAPLR